MGGVGDNAHGPALIKFFCFFLFTKRSLSLHFAELRRSEAVQAGAIESGRNLANNDWAVTQG
jgi:hypothetical protein